MDKIKIIKSLREKNQHASDKYVQVVNQSKILANKLSEVTEASNIEDSAYCVRRVDLDNEISMSVLRVLSYFVAVLLSAQPAHACSLPPQGLFVHVHVRLLD